MSQHPVRYVRVPKCVSAVIARDGYAALPTTPRQDCVQDVEALCTQANLQHPEHLHDSPKQQISNGAALKQQQQVFPSSVPKVHLSAGCSQNTCKPGVVVSSPHMTAWLCAQADQLRLTPVRRVRRAQVNCNRPPHNESSLYAQANARSSHIPGPGQYSSGSDSQLRKQDFRRPHDPVGLSSDLLHLALLVSSLRVWCHVEMTTLLTSHIPDLYLPGMSHVMCHC